MSNGFVIGYDTKRDIEDMIRERNGGKVIAPQVAKNATRDNSIAPLRIVSGGSTHTESGTTFVEGKVLGWDNADMELVDLVDCWILELD